MCVSLIDAAKLISFASRVVKLFQVPKSDALIFSGVKIKFLDFL